MKFKTILACAVLGLVIFNGRLNAAVESDVVGYQNIDIGNIGYVMISLPFANLDSTDAGYPIQQISGVLSKHDVAARADALMVMDPVTKSYTNYQYKTIGWVKDGETNPTTDTIPLGASVFVKKARSTGEVTVSGKVLTEPTATVSLTVGLNLVANPYPTAIKIADITGALAANDNAARSDKIMTLDPSTKVYTTYQLKSIGWVKEGENSVTTDTIDACEGFVFQKVRTTGSLTFTRPF